MKRELQKNEVLVTENEKVKKIHAKSGAETAFFEKEFTSADNEKYVKLYVYVNYGSDKSTVVIKPAGEKKVVDIKTGDIDFLDERNLYKEAYQAFLDKKEQLNPKPVKKAPKKEKQEEIIEALAE